MEVFLTTVLAAFLSDASTSAALDLETLLGYGTTVLGWFLTSFGSILGFFMENPGLLIWFFVSLAGVGLVFFKKLV